MRIHALTTGTVRLKHAFLFARQNLRRQLDLFLPGPWSEPMPIHCWAIEHAGGLTLVDTGETAVVRDVPSRASAWRRIRSCRRRWRQLGLDTGDVRSVVLTHMHGDHMDGAVHLNRPVLVHDRERAFSRTTGARVMQKLLRQPVPAGVEFTRFSLDGGGDATLRTILAHGREHPTVYLPSHDPESVARLEQKATLQPVGGALEGSIESL